MREFQKISTRKKGEYEAAFREEKPSLFQRLAAIFGHTAFFWLAVAVVLFFVLESQGRFYFFFIEQRQLFLYDAGAIASYFARPGGCAQLVADYLMQFFAQPYLGAALMSALLTTVGMLSVSVMRRIAPHAEVWLLGLLPTAILLLMTFNTNYSYAGTVAYALMLAMLYAYFFIPTLIFQVAYATVATALLFWWGGPVAFLFSTCIFLWELATRFWRAYGFLLPLAVAVGTAIWGVYDAWAGEYRLLLAPDGYYAPLVSPDPLLYALWACLPVMLTVAYFLRGRKVEKNEIGRRVMETALQFVLIGGLLWIGRDRLTDHETSGYSKELECYLRQGRWDDLIARYTYYNTYHHTPLNTCMLGIALAERGQLADSLFRYAPRGAEDVVPTWDGHDPQAAALLSDLYFSMGYIDVAQRMALEANAGMGDRSPRMIKRLAETSLIRGAYPLAEKYLTVLERTRYYGRWARDSRRFLYNDSAIVADSLLGRKRRCLTAAVGDLPHTLHNIAEHNPTHRASIEYAGVILLLDRDLGRFRTMTDSCVGRMVLPRLPKSFQEATTLYVGVDDTTARKRYHLPADVTTRYADFRRRAGSARSNNGASEALREAFGDTYWYYFSQPRATK